MMMRKVMAVGRAVEYSPNCEVYDAMILAAVCTRLHAYGYEVDVVNESEPQKVENSSCSLYISMARGKRMLDILSAKEEKGALVLNPAKSLLHNNRRNITLALIKCGAPVPQSEILEAGGIPSIKYPMWIKRADECAQRPEDVSYLETEEGLRGIWDNFVSRGIKSAVACEHAKGDLVKFYGVGGTDFFYTYLPTENGGVGKFGAEKINGRPNHYEYNASLMKAECDRIAQVLSMPVYGGDCVVDALGNFKIIDFNDWPSYSRCREEAADATATLFCRMAEEIQTKNN